MELNGLFETHETEIYNRLEEEGKGGFMDNLRVGIPIQMRRWLGRVGELNGTRKLSKLDLGGRAPKMKVAFSICERDRLSGWCHLHHEQKGQAVGLPNIAGVRVHQVHNVHLPELRDNYAGS